MSDVNEKDTLSLDSLIKSVQAVPEVELPQKTPLEMAKEAKEKNTGMVIEKKDFTDGSDPKQFRNSIENDRREKDFTQYMDDMDQLIETAQSVKVLAAPETPLEAAAMIDQLDRIAKAKNKVTIENPSDTDGNEMFLDEKEKAGSGLQLPDGSQKNFFAAKDETVADAVAQTVDPNAETPVIAEEVKADEDVIDEHHDNLVKVLIDKTGLGTSRVEFTPEEREKLSASTEIRITEVEEVEIGTYEFVAPEKTFVENLEADEAAVGTTLVPLVCSRYRAKMKGIGYGQLGDLIISQQSPTFEQYFKSYSTIYNNIVNTTIGKFTSFDDFLKKTSYLDMNTLLYGLIVSTYPEVDSVGMRCGRCGQSFEQKYFVRELMDLKNASVSYLEKLDALMNCNAEDFTSYAEAGPLHTRKMIKLPKCGYVIEFGIASAYDYLYQVLGNVLNENFEKNHPDDTNGILQLNALYLGMIRSISVPVLDPVTKQPTKRAVKYETFEDMIQALYRVPPEDIVILSTILNRYNEAYVVDFTIKNSTCPRCKNVVEYQSINLQEIIFFKFQLLMSTEVNVENMRDL